MTDQDLTCEDKQEPKWRSDPLIIGIICALLPILISGGASAIPIMFSVGSMQFREYKKFTHLKEELFDVAVFADSNHMKLSAVINSFITKIDSAQLNSTTKTQVKKIWQQADRAILASTVSDPGKLLDTDFYSPDNHNDYPVDIPHDSSQVVITKVKKRIDRIHNWEYLGNWEDLGATAKLVLSNIVAKQSVLCHALLLSHNVIHSDTTENSRKIYDTLLSKDICWNIDNVFYGELTTPKVITQEELKDKHSVVSIILDNSFPRLCPTNIVVDNCANSNIATLMSLSVEQFTLINDEDQTRALLDTLEKTKIYIHDLSSQIVHHQ